MRENQTSDYTGITERHDACNNDLSKRPTGIELLYWDRRQNRTPMRVLNGSHWVHPDSVDPVDSGKVLASDVSRVKFGKMDRTAGTPQQGWSCPGDVLWDGEVVGEFECQLEDAHVCSYSHEQKITGYSASVTYLGREIHISVSMTELRLTGAIAGHGRPIKGATTHKAKRRLKQVLARILKHIDLS